MKQEELFFRLALARVKGVGPQKYRKLISVFGSATEVFKQTKKMLRKPGGITASYAENLGNFNEFDLVEQELKYNEKHNIHIFCFDDANYPSRLRNCIDSPPVLFFKGNAPLDHSRIVSIIGTRSFTEYGRRACEQLIEDLQQYDVLVVSGLAFGIDSIAHRSCLKHNIPTVGVVAHGLDSIYPRAHAGIARQMQEQGGLLSEYFSHTVADKCNFPSRNRIVAGLSDATIVIETGARGGSMITAEIAFSYNRDLFCFPGRSSDEKSAGCNHLIKSLKAQLVTGADDIAKELGWIQGTPAKPVQRELFIELSEEERNIVNILRQNPSVHIDDLLHLSRLSSSQVAASMLHLEMQQIIRVMPGKMVSLCN